MGTTLLFAELVIIGLEVIVWLGLLALNVLGTGWLAGIPFDDLANWQLLLTAVLLSVVYVLGVLFDRVADWAFFRWDGRIRRRELGETDKALGVMRFEISRGNAELNHWFEYTRSRIRLARASALSFAITTGLAAAFVLFRLDPGLVDLQVPLLALVISMGGASSAIAVFAWRALMMSYVKFVKANHDQAKARAGTVKTS